MKKLKSGFTLSEVIVTLSIVGILAAVLFPIFMNAQPNQEMVMFKKAYFNTTKIVSELINDDDLYPEREEDPDHDGFANITIRDMTDGEREATFRGIQYQGARKFCGLFAAKLGQEGSCDSRISLAAGGNFRTGDGVTWSMPVTAFGSDEPENIYVDINGPGRGNNCSRNGTTGILCSDNEIPDQFVITVNKFGTVRPGGNIERLYLSSNRINRPYRDFVNGAADALDDGGGDLGFGEALDDDGGAELESH